MLIKGNRPLEAVGPDLALDQIHRHLQAGPLLNELPPLADELLR